MPPEYGHATHPAVAMPIGGIGTGTVALHADGSLRQWQLANTGNHRGYVPHGFFALRAGLPSPPRDVVRVLQARPVAVADPAPLITDGEIPPGLTDVFDAFPPVAAATLHATYPHARLSVEEPELPLQVVLEAFNPLVPGDVEASGLPVALFTIALTNPGPGPVPGWLAAAAQNFVGWDGVTPIDGNRCALYGGNVNRVRHRLDGWTQVVMDNPSLPDGDPGQGQLVLAADGSGAVPFPRWRSPRDLAAFLDGRGFPTTWDPAPPLGVGADPHRSPMRVPHGPSPAGETWNAALAVPFHVEPGATVRLRFLLAWHFPHRFVDGDPAGPALDRGESRLFLGNHYATRFTDAVDVAEHVARDWDPLEKATRRWTDALAELPDGLGARMAAQLVPVRSPTAFRAADGRVHFFEGVRGASTGMWGPRYGGSCPLDCTHVGAYAQGPARVFPQLERSLRDTELHDALAPDGTLPHRVVAPVWLPQLAGRPLAGPTTPAVDGMLGTVLKVYRELRCGAGREWAVGHWPAVRSVLQRVGADADDDGVLRGRQPVTHDIDLHGANSFVGALWLAALRAGQRLAEIAGDTATVSWCEERFASASSAYDELLWTGEFYRQVLAPTDPVEQSYGEGCLSDQLIGQWWAHQLDLGHVLPAEHVRTALRSIVRHNLRTGFADHHHDFRVFADRDDTGLLVCTWPHGGRPDVPIRYADEVWTGTEWAVAALCLQEGLAGEARAVLDGLWARYDGTRRNPFNEVECGDHYVRSMAGWSVLEAATGTAHDAEAGTLRVDPPGERWCVPVVIAGGWGQVERRADGITVTCRHGRIALRELTLPAGFPARPVDLQTGESLTVRQEQ